MASLAVHGLQENYTTVTYIVHLAAFSQDYSYATKMLSTASGYHKKCIPTLKTALRIIKRYYTVFK